MHRRVTSGKRHASDSTDREILKPLIEKAAELGYTPAKAEVGNSAKIKGRFRCWKDAVKAAGLPAVNDPEQVKKRKRIDINRYDDANKMNRSVDNHNRICYNVIKYEYAHGVPEGDAFG